MPIVSVNRLRNVPGPLVEATGGTPVWSGWDELAVVVLPRAGDVSMPVEWAV